MSVYCFFTLPNFTKSLPNQLDACFSSLLFCPAFHTSSFYPDHGPCCGDDMFFARQEVVNAKNPTKVRNNWMWNPTAEPVQSGSLNEYLAERASSRFKNPYASLNRLCCLLHVSLVCLCLCGDCKLVQEWKPWLFIDLQVGVVFRYGTWFSALQQSLHENHRTWLNHLRRPDCSL